jgi:hypothetical protein
MLRNPFTPAEIASSPDDFFGREKELREAKRGLSKGSVSIQGQIGIGKSSLLARTRLEMEGFGTEHTATSIFAVGDKDITNADQLARTLLEDMVEVDEKQKKITFKLGSFVEVGSNEIYRNFVEGRNVAALLRLLEQKNMKQLLAGRELLLITIDEADKCPAVIARLIRQITTHTQHRGIKGVHFLMAGVSPFYQQMLAEDDGISRFVYGTIMLAPMDDADATELIETKLGLVAADARRQGIELQIDPGVVPRMVSISGGHPHLLQLLGSYLIENENENPDQMIDAQDLVTSLRRICYEDRAQIYDSTLHKLDIEGKLDAFRKLMLIAPSKFPTRIPQPDAMEVVDSNTLHWFFENNLFSVETDGTYRLLDEFLRIRLMMDGAVEEEQGSQLEQRLLRGSWTLPDEEETDEEETDEEELERY